jgi:hypothetical protein
MGKSFINVGANFEQLLQVALSGPPQRTQEARAADVIGADEKVFAFTPNGVEYGHVVSVAGSAVDEGDVYRVRAPDGRVFLMSRTALFRDTELEKFELHVLVLSVVAKYLKDLAKVRDMAPPDGDQETRH